MDELTAKALSDRLYDKRRTAALSVEKTVRQLLAQNSAEARDQISKIIDQLCQDYAYAVHQPNARNGGSIGLAAVAIALGSAHIAEYLDRIIMPVLACFSDQAAQVRYYACEALYNIAKVAKGEILVYFNDIFDVLCRLYADSENSIKNGADLFNRLIKDIVSEKAATYVSVINQDTNGDSYLVQSNYVDSDGYYVQVNAQQNATAFSLTKFIPVLKERLFTNNPYTRLFLVDWIMLLDSVPDLELIAYLPNFLGGVLSFLTDSRKDVRIHTNQCLNMFLEEIKKIVEIKKIIEKDRQLRMEKIQKQKQLEELKKRQFQEQAETSEDRKRKSEDKDVADINEKEELSEDDAHGDDEREDGEEKEEEKEKEKEKDYEEEEEKEKEKEEKDYEEEEQEQKEQDNEEEEEDDDKEKEQDDSEFEDELSEEEDDSESNEESYYNDSDGALYIPLQDVHINFPEINRILIANLDVKNEEVQLVVLNWIETLLNITPTSFIPLICDLLEILIMTMSSNESIKIIKDKAKIIDRKLMELIYLYLDVENNDDPTVQAPVASDKKAEKRALDNNRNSVVSDKRALIYSPESQSTNKSHQSIYSSLINILTSNLLSVDENTKLLLLDWLMMLHKKSFKLFLSNSLSKTFQILLKSLCGESALAIEKDLVLISEISASASDDRFLQLMLDLISLFKNDRTLLELKGNFIIRKLCINLNAERIYRSLAHALFDSDSSNLTGAKNQKNNLGFISIMIQILNSNLITAPELAELRNKVRNLNAKEDWQLFATLFKSWSYNAPACLSLCLLSQNYELAYNLLKIFVEFEITVNLLIQLDILVQLLESPVFVKLRLQLLEPEKYPYLLKCLYGILMLLPQSNAFNILQKRLNSINGFTVNSNMPLASSSSVLPPSGASMTSAAAASANSKLISSRKQKYNELIKTFREIQQKHEDVRLGKLSRKTPSLSDESSSVALKNESSSAAPKNESSGVKNESSFSFNSNTKPKHSVLTFSFNLGDKHPERSSSGVFRSGSNDGATYLKGTSRIPASAAATARASSNTTNPHGNSLIKNFAKNSPSVVIDKNDAQASHSRSSSKHFHKPTNNDTQPSGPTGIPSLTTNSSTNIASLNKKISNLSFNQHPTKFQSSSNHGKLFTFSNHQGNAASNTSGNTPASSSPTGSTGSAVQHIPRSGAMGNVSTSRKGSASLGGEFLRSKFEATGNSASEPFGTTGGSPSETDNNSPAPSGSS